MFLSSLAAILNEAELLNLALRYNFKDRARTYTITARKKDDLPKEIKGLALWRAGVTIPGAYWVPTSSGGEHAVHQENYIFTYSSYTTCIR